MSDSIAGVLQMNEKASPVEGSFEKTVGMRPMTIGSPSGACMNSMPMRWPCSVM